MVNQEFTDDSMLIEIAGGIGSTFLGDQKNIKITNNPRKNSFIEIIALINQEYPVMLDL